MVSLYNAEGAQDFLEDNFQNSQTVKEIWRALEKMDAAIEHMNNKLHALEVSLNADNH